MRPRIGVPATFEEKYVDVRVLRESVSNNGTAGSSTNDNIVECMDHWRRILDDMYGMYQGIQVAGNMFEISGEISARFHRNASPISELEIERRRGYGRDATREE